MYSLKSRQKLGWLVVYILPFNNDFNVKLAMLIVL